jgi:transcription initiation factor TFIID TATA-box-binding protein
MVEYTIENYIVTTEINAVMNLKDIASNIDNVDYNPVQFPGIVFRLDDPKSVTFILKNGRTVCIGGKSFKESRAALEKVVKILSDNGVKIDNELDINIKNIVVTMELRSRLNLNDVGELFNWKNLTYNPEEFIGLVYQTELDEITILLFDSGKLVCYGAKKLSEVNKVLEKFVNRLHSVGLI